MQLKINFMKPILVIISFLYAASLRCQIKFPEKINYENKGTYLIHLGNNWVLPEDSATIFIRIYGISEHGCEVIDKGSVYIRDRKIQLTDDNRFEKEWFIPIEPGEFEITVKTPYSFFVPLTTKKLKFLKGNYYHITFFLLTKYSFKE